MPYSGKISGTVPSLPHYVNPNSNIRIDLSESCGDVNENSHFVCEIEYSIDGYSGHPYILDCNCGSSITGTLEGILLDDDMNRVDLKVELPRISDPMVGYISLKNWRTYQSTSDFDRVVIKSIRIDWDS